MKTRIVIAAAIATLLFVGAGCASKPTVTPPPVDRYGVPNADQPQEKPVTTAPKPTAADGLDGALNDLSAAQ